jgi:hypothetical protein
MRALPDSEEDSWMDSAPEALSRAALDTAARPGESVVLKRDFIRIRYLEGPRAAIVEFHPKLAGPIYLEKSFEMLSELKPVCIFVYAISEFPESRMFMDLGTAVDWMTSLTS